VYEGSGWKGRNSLERNRRRAVEGDADRQARLLAALQSEAKSTEERRRATQEEKQREGNREKERTRGNEQNQNIQGLEKERRERKGKEKEGLQMRSR